MKHKKYFRDRRELMGRLEPIVDSQQSNSETPNEKQNADFSYLDIPDNSQLMQEFAMRFPSYHIFLCRYAGQVNTKYARMQRESR